MYVSKTNNTSKFEFDKLSRNRNNSYFLHTDR